MPKKSRTEAIFAFDEVQPSGTPKRRFIDVVEENEKKVRETRIQRITWSV